MAHLDRDMYAPLSKSLIGRLHPSGPLNLTQRQHWQQDRKHTLTQPSLAMLTLLGGSTSPSQSSIQFVNEWMQNTASTSPDVPSLESDRAL